ncbi:hypothetical protein E2C01_057125 [Portunus trituberculatus]|uniref:Uncharacterized protein n=1 Tax=Portunus trituberculatus TaxID=210409 RepID=A0A5B7H2I1_PORTR|nr:hypothetical protein [Portunus trituberculatus]
MHEKPNEEGDISRKKRKCVAPRTHLVTCDGAVLQAGFGRTPGEISAGEVEQVNRDLLGRAGRGCGRQVKGEKARPRKGEQRNEEEKEEKILAGRRGKERSWRRRRKT